MRTFIFNKLVRDNIVPSMTDLGSTPHTKKINDTEFIHELVKKIQEEAREFELQPNDDVVELIADVQEVLDTLRTTMGITEAQVTEKQKEKMNKTGGFESRDFISTIECPDNYPWIEYYENNPEKYPEV